MSVNAIETLRENVVNRTVTYAEVDEAVAAVEALLEAAKKDRRGHSNGCDGSDYPCSCGYDTLSDAVRRVETGQ